MNRSLQMTMRSAIALWMMLVGIGACWAAPPESNHFEADSESIHIVSNTLTVDTQNMRAEFSGDVQATQGNMVIQSDQLTVYYDRNLTKEGSEGMDEQSVRKIIAVGGVRIHFDNRVAVADQAVYTANDRMFILTGKEVKISSEKDSIQGEKIIINRADGTMKVVRSEYKQVEAIFTGSQNGMK